MSRQFRWVELDDAFSTGSSIMPQKKNPDIAELTRGRSARLISLLMDMLVALKGLPFSYNRDLSEDKYSAFEAIDVLHMVLPAMAGMMRTLQVNKERMRADATQGFTLATEVADWLSRRGVPFAQAHEITGAMVRLRRTRGGAAPVERCRVEQHQFTPVARSTHGSHARGRCGGA